MIDTSRIAARCARGHADIDNGVYEYALHRTEVRRPDRIDDRYMVSHYGASKGKCRTRIVHDFSYGG